LEREQQERDRRKQEKKEKRRKEKIEREKKDIERREKELKRREPYMCPGEANLEKTAIKEAKKANLARENKQKVRKSSAPFSTPVGRKPLKAMKELELRGGVFYNRCDCVKRNGLQDDCQRVLCQGRPACLTDPPMCIPGGGIGYISPCYPVCEPPCYN
jgi:hypothetical protein